MYPALNGWVLLHHVLSHGRILVVMQDAEEGVKLSFDACPPPLQHEPWASVSWKLPSTHGALSIIQSLLGPPSLSLFVSVKAQICSLGGCVLLPGRRSAVRRKMPAKLGSETYFVRYLFWGSRFCLLRSLICSYSFRYFLLPIACYGTTKRAETINIFDWSSS